MPGKINRGTLLEIWRFYQAGVVNLLFGLAAYSLFVWLGMNIFVAQVLAQIIGMGFNYFTYSSHVFQSRAPNKARFLVAYGVGYLIALATLAVVSHFVASPYLAGAVSALIVSAINYMILSKLVFRTQAA